MPEHTERTFTQGEVAELRGCSLDTVRHDRRDRGRYPGAYRLDDPSGTWVIPYPDLVAAGDLDPAAGQPADEQPLARSRRERELIQLRDELTDERARREGLEARLADRDGEIVFLRRLLDAAVAAGRAG